MLHFGITEQLKDHCVTFIGSNKEITTPLFYNWTVPREAQFISILCIGGGGGGTSGGAGASGSSRTGGGGGGPGGVCSVLYAARSLPGVIYCVPGNGGLGGTGNAGFGDNGTSSWVTACDNTGTLLTEPSICYATGSQAPGTATAGGAAGTASVMTSMKMAYRAIAVNLVPAQSAGGTGGSAGGAAPTNAIYNMFTCQGAGGGGTSTSTTRNGASITTFANPNTFRLPNSTVIVQGGTAGGVINGANGWDNLQDTMRQNTSHLPSISLGGAGGASTDNGQGGIGGNGAIGSGGGGGGAGVTASSGAGGDGGPGFIMIEWW